MTQDPLDYINAAIVDAKARAKAIERDEIAPLTRAREILTGERRPLGRPKGSTSSRQVVLAAQRRQRVGASRKTTGWSVKSRKARLAKVEAKAKA